MADRLMPLQNRVTPEGEIIACAARGTMFGNRGGAIHDAHRQLTSSRWRSKAWICCVLDFKGRHRIVMTPNRYTELFFLDEATALAAGHRPCFECRRHDALAFAAAWHRARRLSARPRAPDMDAVLHPERVTRRGEKVTYRARLDCLPDGTFVRWADAPHLLLSGRLRPWTSAGYQAGRRTSRTHEVEVLTPRSIVAALSAGYAPKLHVSASHPLGIEGGD
jgi:hypothetical protein